MTVIPLNRHKLIEDQRDDRDVDDEEIQPRKKKREFDIEEVFADLGIKSFKHEYRRLSKLAGDDDFSSSKSAYALLRSQFAMLINALPVVEAAMHKYKSDRAAYAMVALSNHLREVAHDLRAYGDQAELAERVRKDVVQGVLSSLATSIVSDLIKTRQRLYETLPPNSAKKVDEALKNCQKRLTSVFSDADMRAGELLNRALNAK
jgi:hypothetical protein